MPKSAKLSGIKSLRCYTIPEAAGVTGVSDRTIRAWIKQGLTAMTDERPTLVRGDALISYIQRQRQGRKSRLSPDEFYCLKCRAARKPAGGLVDCETDGTRAKLSAICETCETIMHKPIPPGSVPTLAKTFDVTLRGEPSQKANDASETTARNRH
ncbi:helix-turn-helix domain-containing protein [Leisingera sp. NJS204]|uniref:helix-turn-helix domain-containing protein n=1 Tax=Leisingera sp. NJS204 TaxID=2508307 RepID=UPI0010138818|nr:helix-turn-helix domain-containing protein [Leisingera sp. NJS204]QAX30707.1 DNA-binding protein [Leisingera sp. NJS204]